MTTYTAALEALDVKLGHVHTVADWHRIGEKAQHTPADLTDADLIVLEGFGGPSSAAAARARREKALAPALPPDPPATKAKSATPNRDHYPRKEESWADYVKRCPDVPVPLVLFDGFRTFVHEMNTKNVERNQRLDTLEARVKQLEAKPFVTFLGTWERGKTYEPGEAVVRDGGLWICRATTPGEPSKDFVGWQVAVRKGSL